MVAAVVVGLGWAVVAEKQTVTDRRQMVAVLVVVAETGAVVAVVVVGVGN